MLMLSVYLHVVVVILTSEYDVAGLLKCLLMIPFNFSALWRVRDPSSGYRIA
jgi:hypothetical protein